MFKSLLARAREVRAAELEGESGLEGGFTLIELMVVLLIIAILLAIAIPTFLGVSGSARDRSAQSNATNALTELVSYYQNSQSFNPAAPGSLAAAVQVSEPAFTWSDGATPCTATSYQKCVSVQNEDAIASGDGQAVVLAVMSGNNNNCWFVASVQTGTSTNPLTPVATTGFALNASGTGSETGATTAGTYYAEYQGSVVGGNSKCAAGEPNLYTGGWVWYSSYSAAAAASASAP